MKLSTRGKRVDEKAESTVNVQKLGSCSRHATTINDFFDMGPSCVAADATKGVFPEE